MFCYFSFGLPLFAALMLAARERRIGRATSRSATRSLLPFLTWGVLAEFPEERRDHDSGPRVASQTGFSAWQREVIAFAYQFGSLILPTVVPAVVWVLMHRRCSKTSRAGAPSDATRRLSRGQRSARDRVLLALELALAQHARCTLPVVVIGSASMNSISFGYSYGARMLAHVLAGSRPRARGDGACPGASTMNALTTLPRVSSGDGHDRGVGDRRVLARGSSRSRTDRCGSRPP